MPFDPFTLALGGISALPSLYAAYQQNKKADELTLQNTTTAGEREQLAMSRQAAATNRLPNQGQQEGRLAQVQAGAVQNAQLGAASSADFLASAGAADTRRQQGEQQLGVQGLAYNDKSRQQLRADLTTQSNRQQHDLDVYNNTKAALTQSSATNLNNAIGTGASYAASAYNMGAPGSRSTPSASSMGSDGQNALGTMYNDPTGGYPMGGYNTGGYGRRSARYNNGINFGQ